MAMPARKYICPQCKQRMGVEILFGMPDCDAFEQAERGELFIGGCVVGEAMPDRRCLACHHEWPIKRRNTPDDWSPGA